MPLDLSVDLIKATVQLEQPLGDGSRTVGTGFLISDPTPDGKPRTILVTAAHVFEKMPSMSAKIGYRIEGSDSVWRYDPETLKIRDGDHPLWVKHPTRDVAVMVVEAPPEFVKAAIPLNYLAQDDTFNKFNLGPGDEMMALGFPRGLSANPAGFPILRSGRVASYPLAPATNFPTFLMDFSVFPGNSGGPVFMAEGARRRPGANESQEVQFVAGLLTQQVELSGERLEIGIVTHAKFIRETLAMLDKVPGAPITQARATKPEPVMPGATPAAAVSALAMGASH
ncbi:serine protease [Caulobacter segnis]|nr:serine protease [Caulobacter segnis]